VRFCFSPEMRTLFASPEKKVWGKIVYASCRLLKAVWRRRELKSKTNGFSSWGGSTMRHLISDTHMQDHGSQRPKNAGLQRAVNAWLPAEPASQPASPRSSEFLIFVLTWLAAVCTLLCCTSVFERWVK
jgi:hypothetical protein